MADLENPDIVDESTPLIAIDREPPPLKDIKEQTFKETLVGAAALIGRKSHLCGFHLDFDSSCLPKYDKHEKIKRGT